MAIAIKVHRDRLLLRLTPEKSGFLTKFWKQQSSLSFADMTATDKDLAIAIADLRALDSENPGEVRIAGEEIEISHRVAAALGGKSAEQLGLPPVVDLTLRTDAEGLLGTRDFRLRYDWLKQGQRQLPVRTGAILQTGDGLRRLPFWMMEALDAADNFKAEGSDVDHWGALARFRNALEPGVQMSADSQAARVSMTDFLSGLSVKVADQFAITPNRLADDFDILPFSSSNLEGTGLSPEGVPEVNAEISGDDLYAFQRRTRERGALPAFRLAPQSFLVVDRDAAPALEVLTQMQHAPPEERAAFIRNPRPRITEAIEAHLRKTGRLEGLTPDGEEQAIEAAAGPVFVETREYSERVTGITVFKKKILESLAGGSTTWLPEVFVERLSAALSSMSMPELEALRTTTDDAISQGEQTVAVGDLDVPARPQFVALLDDMIAPDGDKSDRAKAEKVESGPLVLETVDNFESNLWSAKLKPREVLAGRILPRSIRTTLKAHQIDSFGWQMKAWAAGLPGILNADEQGLGKTLQTIAFLSWLKENTSRAESSRRGPILVVAPTSLLENWEQEVRQHVDDPGLGHLVRLYGSAIGGRKLSGAAGRDIDSGEAKLDLAFVKEALEEGRAHRFWFLTTYTTLTNYQHSLARIPFAAAVFDEIQAIKNPDSLRANAARAINADFRIGLTGTPIENSIVDLWAIMDQLAPGSLDSLKDFRARYSSPDPTNMAELHSRVFMPVSGLPPLALRRLKDEVARDLPAKNRRLHPRLMPNYQATVYEDARLKLARGGLGAALKMLHHIRSVSVHPALQGSSEAGDFIEASGRLSAAFEILRRIKAAGERALVFIEHRQMQFRFIELAKAEFNLKAIDLINGDTPIPRRQAIVNRFQRHLDEDGGFDLLVLGPKAAGTGLTLTAATHVIHLSRWWNPAVEEQCNDRVHRIGQTREVMIHVPMAIHSGYRENSFDCLLHSLMQRKRKLANSALWPMGDTEGDVSELHKILAGEQTASHGDPLSSSIAAMFRRDEQPPPRIADDGSVNFN